MIMMMMAIVIKNNYGEEEDEEEYPNQRLGLCNVKSVSFIAVLARLAIEFHSFEDHERGGLLIEDKDTDNTFVNLMYNVSTRYPDQNALILMQFIRLRRIGFLKKYDIKDYRLICLFCGNNSDFTERGP